MTLIVFFFAFQVHAFNIQVYALFKNMAIIQVDGQQRKLRVGQTSPEGIRLISANSELAVLEINGKKENYQLGEHVSIAFSEQEKQEARIWSEQGMYMTPGLINGQAVNFMVDTGATWIAMNQDDADRLGINYSYGSTQAWASTANGRTSVRKVLLKKVKVGGIELYNVEAAIMANSNSNYILLGNSFLNRVEMKREGQVMILKEK